MLRGHRRTFRTLGVLGATAIVVAGCGGGDEVPVDAGPSPAPAPTPDASIAGDPGATQNIDPITGMPVTEDAGLGATAEIPDLSGGDIGGGLGAIDASPIFEANATDPDKLVQPDDDGEDVTDESATPAPSTDTSQPAVQFTGAKISIDGVVSDVELNSVFPDDNPVFRLLSISGGNIEVELIAGEFTSGGGSGVLLDKGEEVSLVNSSEQLTYVVTYLRPVKGSDGITF